MKSFTRTSILKSRLVEITSPCLLENPKLENKFKEQGVPVEFPVFSVPLDDHIDTEKDEEKNNIIDEAKKEASEIIAKAQKQAQEILQKAHLESKEIKKKAAEEARAEVIPLAKDEGYKKGLQEAQNEAKEIKNRAKTYLDIAQKVLRQEYEKADQQLLKLSIKIAEKILNSSLKCDPQILLNVIRNLVQMPMEKEGITLYLSPQDYQWYTELPEQDKFPYTVVADRTLKTGDVLLECSEGIFDSRIDSQLERMELYLTEELKHGELANSDTKS